ncbi:conserved hypothetical protein [Burkholderia pseudomallei 305]|nr:hypothetical protein BOC49_30160 [Burkholderia pseudomallei]EBA45004.1 conserved hypothetical protein [Burkholderia pseudomallei 305]MBM5621916.1 hypothetical protein [Burkholderia pseudomallei]MBM5625668.1 hypothetical protein [Burkholderia pseudomallei]MBM5633391.1 hypothetical protein [Burkholderia pseudomallei]
MRSARRIGTAGAFDLRSPPRGTDRPPHRPRSTPRRAPLSLAPDAPRASGRARQFPRIISKPHRATGTRRHHPTCAAALASPIARPPHCAPDA